MPINSPVLTLRQDPFSQLHHQAKPKTKHDPFSLFEKNKTKTTLVLPSSLHWLNLKAPWYKHPCMAASVKFHVSKRTAKMSNYLARLSLFRPCTQRKVLCSGELALYWLLRLGLWSLGTSCPTYCFHMPEASGHVHLFREIFNAKNVASGNCDFLCLISVTTSG